MSDCIFCKIANKKIPSEIIYEDNDTIAFLDIAPAMQGQTVVIPKKHTHSDLKQADEDLIYKTMISAKKTAKLLDNTLNTRCCYVIEGFDVNHFHIKIYPTTPKNHLKTTPQTKVDPKDLKKLASIIKK